MRRQTLGTTLAVALGAALALAAIAVAGPMKGTKGPDTLTGTEGPDQIHGKGGNDTIDALGGNDRVKGDQGADDLDAGAGDDFVKGLGDGRTADQIACGDGTDTVKADRADVVAADCENVKVAGSKGKGHGKKDKPKGGEGKGHQKGNGKGHEKGKGKGHEKDPLPEPDPIPPAPVT
jgi:Ca2+-binding RTX toxin-like protein